MMDALLFYFTLGGTHVLDAEGLDHFYFIVALSLPFAFSDWKRLLFWVTLFTLGHSFSLLGNYYMGLRFSGYWIELLIPITIAISCVPLLFGKLPKTSSFSAALTFVYGCIHGLGFGRYFSMMVEPENATLGLFSFALGVEAAQLFIVILVLCFNITLLKVYAQGLMIWRKALGLLIFLMACYMILERI